MLALLCFVLAILPSPLKSKSRLEAENVALRHQLLVLRRQVQGRVRLTNNDRWFLVQLVVAFRPFCRSSRSPVPRHLSIGIGRAFVAIGVGSRAQGESVRIENLIRLSVDGIFGKDNCSPDQDSRLINL
jgi:hypothetical protein